MPVISALGRLRQEDNELEPSLVYLERSCERGGEGRGGRKKTRKEMNVSTLSPCFFHCPVSADVQRPWASCCSLGF
jgi:hypothetical protein